MEYRDKGGGWVKMFRIKNQLLIVMLAVGFFVGILYENIVSKQFGVTLEIFQNYFINQYKKTEIITEEYLWYVAKVRALPVSILVVLGHSKWKKIITCVMTFWMGFLSGILIVAAMIQLGTKGILFFLVGMTPHVICYILAYSVLLTYYYHYPRRSWNLTKTIFVVFTMALGIFMETYVNPLLIKMISKYM